MRSKTATTLQPCTTAENTENVTVSATDDVGWMDRVTAIVDTNVTLVLSGTNFSVDSNNTWTPDDLTANHSARETTLPMLNGSDSTGSQSDPWHVTAIADTSSHGGTTVANLQTNNGTTELDVNSPSPEDWRALTVGGTSSRGRDSRGTESALNKDVNPWLLLSRWIGNDSVAQQNLLEELINKNKDEMVRVSGRQLCIYQR